MKNASAEHIDHSMSELLEVIKVGDIAMLTTIDENHILSSRPMETCYINQEGEIFFFSTLDKHLSEELEVDVHVNVNYCFDADQEYVSISGNSTMYSSKEDIASFWQEKFQRWIPDGLDDPNLILLKIIPHRAEYWQENSKLKRMTKRLLAGEKLSQSSHAVIES